MNTTLNNESITELSPNQASRIAGFSYLMVFILGIFGNFFVFEQLIVPENTAATVQNIIANKTLFRLGIASWMIVIIFDLVVAWALYIFLKPVHQSIAILAAWLRLVFTAIFAYSFVDYLKVLQLLTDTDYVNAFNPDQIQAYVKILLNMHNVAMHVSYVFFGLHIFVLGYMILKSGYIPRLIGILLLIASVGYLINSFGNFLSPAYAESKAAFMIFVAVPAMISEFSLTYWLIFKGGKV